MRIFLPRPFTTPILYHLKRAQTIKAPYFVIHHIFNTHPYKSIIGESYTEYHNHTPYPPPRFEATHYLTEGFDQHQIHNISSLRNFNYIHVNTPYPSHFILPSDIQPKDRLLFI